MWGIYTPSREERVARQRPPCNGVCLGQDRTSIRAESRMGPPGPWTNLGSRVTAVHSPLDRLEDFSLDGRTRRRQSDYRTG
jgi:hypothetical protein